MFTYDPHRRTSSPTGPTRCPRPPPSPSRRRRHPPARVPRSDRLEPDVAQALAELTASRGDVSREINDLLRDWLAHQTIAPSVH